MKHLFLVLCIALTIISCKTEKEPKELNSNEKLPYALEETEDGLVFEVFDDSITDANRYNYNNRILKPGRSFVYSFKHQTKDGDIKYFEKYKDNDEYVWKFVEGDYSRAVKTVTIGVLDENPMEEWIPDYNQTNLSYKLEHDEGYNMSGGVENEANLWIHPPRDMYFSILELNPFPYIKAPYKVGTEWTWKLAIGSQWGDPRWKEWEGNITNEYRYKITGETDLKTKLGTLKCLIIDGKAVSNLGTTSLISYFNEDYGFVKLDYTNIDGSKTYLDILQVEDGD